MGGGWVRTRSWPCSAPEGWEVYRARDTRLDRIVAIKVLPAHLIANEASRARFEREARAISALSHPNICAHYDVGRDGDTEYLVMEYLEGQTLADKLARGPLPKSQFLKLGAQIAEALQHAHRAGIVHRDLKPGNIMITNSGAKLLDFGLAKFADPVSQPLDQEETATRREPLTAEGRVVGTFQYMSPEQVEGRPLDHRTDIFSLGVILYEMVTGKRPFVGSSRATLIASILSSDPVSIRREIVYEGAEGSIISAVPGPSGRWDDATTHELFRLPDLQHFAVLPDGQSFLVQRGSPGPSDSIYHVVLGVH